MGKMMGAFDPDDQLDRPDLNKCPDCGCYFATEACPLCGRVCPPDMRAGVRAEPKRKSRRTSSSGRVRFVEWYHSWWFILLMTCLMPVVGIVLFITSPYSRKTKIIVAAVAAAYAVFIYGGLGSLLIQTWTQKPPVNTRISREAYEEKCETVDVLTYYRTAPQREGEYYALTLQIQQRIRMSDAYIQGIQEHKMWQNADAVYICSSPEDPTVVLVLLDCQVGDGLSFRTGDVVRVFGQSSGFVELYTPTGELNEPGLFMAYATVLQ